MTYKLLDLCCRAGGCSMGYYMAGFEVTGVDIEFQPRYPFKFIQSDIFDLDYDFISQFDVIHASPPCQGYSITRHMNKDKIYSTIVNEVRNMLINSNKLYVIENVEGTPLINPLSLVGSMFGLAVKRKRLFECNVKLITPSQYYLAGFKHDIIHTVVSKRHGKADEWRQAMGINWMVKEELTQAIPPLYTEWIGTQLINYLKLSNDRCVNVG